MRIKPAAIVGLVTAALIGAQAPALATGPTPSAAPAAAVSLAAASAPAENPVLLENRRPGSTRWQLPWSGYSLATDSGAQVKGYADATSVNVGQTINIKASVAAPGTLYYAVFRLGHYNGSGGRLVTQGNVPAVTQPACPLDSYGKRACSWSTTKALTVDSSWVSGLYAVVLTRGAYQNYVVFTVRDDARKAQGLVQQTTNTYQAYNNWPNNGTGKSLYAYNSKGATTAGGTTAAVKVSFNRPYSDHGAGLLFDFEADAARYLESRGFDVKYTTNDNLHTNPGQVGTASVMISPGHDEYWTSEMFTAAEQGRDAGAALSFWGGNNVYWQSRMEDSNRTLVCWRDGSLDPELVWEKKTIRFREAGRSEQPLLGMVWPAIDGAGLVGTEAPWVVADGNHWIYRGTSLTTGTKIAGLVGGEADRRLSNQPAPEGTAWQAVASSPFTTKYGGQGLHEATTYLAPSGAWVFDAGTLTYTRALSRPGKTDARVQGMATNIVMRQSRASLSATTSRAAGPTRYETAVAVSSRTFAAGFGGTVFVATGLNYPDALGAAAATHGDGPVLLVATDQVPAAVESELRRLAPSKVVIVGSSAVVSDGVASALASITGVTPTRLAGPDRYATSAAISSANFGAGVPVAYVATGRDFPDALAAGAAGAQVGGPVLLTQPTGLPTSTATELARLQPRRIVVVGSAAVVPDAIMTELQKYSGQVVRVAGPDRYETSLAIMRDSRAAGAGGLVALATGMDYPDALSAGPMVGAGGGSLVLIKPGNPLAPLAAEEIVRTDPSVVVAVGSAAVVADSVLTAAGRLFDAVNGVAAPKSLSPTKDPATPQAATPALPDPTGPLDGPDQEYRPETTLPWLSQP